MSPDSTLKYGVTQVTRLHTEMIADRTQVARFHTEIADTRLQKLIRSALRTLICRRCDNYRTALTNKCDIDHNERSSGLPVRYQRCVALRSLEPPGRFPPDSAA